METTRKKRIITRKKGIVVSDKSDKTIIVSVQSYKAHPKYLKKIRHTKRYKAHDGENRYKMGDWVEIIPIKPRSGGKNYTVIMN